MRYFHVTPLALQWEQTPYSHVASNVRYISFQHNLQLKTPWAEPQNVKSAPCENKYLLTFRGSTSAIIATTCPRKLKEKPRKKIISEVFFPISEVKQPISWHKKRRKPCVYGLSPLCYYKDNTFSREIQIPLTFRNTWATVKMQRFAAASLWRVLYYEGHMEGEHPSARKRGQVTHWWSQDPFL